MNKCLETKTKSHYAYLDIKTIEVLKHMDQSNTDMYT